MLYTYRAIDQGGKPANGEREASSERELADSLRRDGLILIDAGSPAGKKKLFSVQNIIPSLFNRVSLVERMAFSRNLAVMIGAGVSITRALEALGGQSPNSAFREMIAAIRTSIVGGRTFAESLKSYERVFGALFINMVESGEVSGNLESVLALLARQMKRDYDLRSKVRGAMIYPAIILSALFIIGALMMIFVVPTLTQTFNELGIALPVTTRIIIGSSNFILAYFWYVLAGLTAAAFLFARALRTSRGKRVFDALVLRAPIFGSLIREFNSARFARTLSSLLTAGVSITRSLEITASVLGNTRFRESLAGAAEIIQKGKPLHEILALHPDLFPPMVTQMVQVGEETGTVSRMLLRLALFYEDEVNTVTKNLSSVIEPILMVVIGAVVGFFAISMVQPIYGGLGNL